MSSRIFRTLILAGAAALVPALPALGQLEDYRTRQLMQDVAELQRVVRQQSRQIEQLERQLAQLTSRAPAGAERAEPKEPAPPANDAWLSATTWDRIKVGMSEQDVLKVLGYPTAAREEEGGKVKRLFYTMQVGANGFLSGNIELENNRVRAIHRPALK